MFTPHQLSEIAFAKARFGGYDMAAVDEVLAPLTEDYTAIYNENEQLKRKLGALAKKLEEYRTAESKQTVSAEETKKACAKMMQDAEAKRARILAQANAEADRIRKDAEEAAAATIAASKAVEANPDFIEAVNKAAAAKLSEIQAKMNACIEAMEQIKAGNYELEQKVVEPPKPKLTGKPSVDRPWMQFYPAGADQMVVPEVTMNEYMKMMSRGDNLTVMHYYGTNIRWKTFFRGVDETARSMRAAGLGEGDQIPVLLRAVPEFLVILLAAEKVGASILCRDNTIEENA